MLLVGSVLYVRSYLGVGSSRQRLRQLRSGRDFAHASTAASRQRRRARGDGADAFWNACVHARGPRGVRGIAAAVHGRQSDFERSHRGRREAADGDEHSGATTMGRPGLLPCARHSAWSPAGCSNEGIRLRMSSSRSPWQKGCGQMPLPSVTAFAKTRFLPWSYVIRCRQTRPHDLRRHIRTGTVFSEVLVEATATAGDRVDSLNAAQRQRTRLRLSHRYGARRFALTCCRSLSDRAQHRHAQHPQGRVRR